MHGSAPGPRARIFRRLLAATIVTGSALCALSALPLQAAAQDRQRADSGVVTFDRFVGALVARTPEGRERPLRVSMRNYIIQNRTRLPRVGGGGTMVVHVRAGSLTTVIDGKRQERLADQFWVVPSGAEMAIETGEDSAIIQVVTIGAR